MTRSSSHRPISHRKYVLFAAVACLLGTTLALGSAEVAIRFLLPHKDAHFFAQPKRYYVPDPLLGYTLSRNYPPTRMTGMDGTSPNIAYSNSLGMRDIEPPPHDGKSLRILVLGCSMTEGHGILRPDQPWPRQLQAILSSDPTSPPTVVMNGGVSGYNTFQEVEHGRQLAPEAKPDILLLGYIGGFTAMWGRNSYGPTGQYILQWDILWDAPQLEHFHQTHNRPSRALMNHCYLWRWLMLTLTDTDLEGLPYTRLYGDRFYESSELALNGYKALGKELGIPVVVVYMPLPKEIDLYIANSDIDPTESQVQQICHDLELPYINALPVMMKLFKNEYDDNRIRCADAWTVSALDSHYNAKANKACAQAVAEQLRPLLNTLEPAPL